MNLGKVILCVIILIPGTRSLLLAQRNVDNIFCMGNGRMAAYGSKANIIQLFGPPYSSPSLLKMTLNDTSLQVKSSREKSTAIWSHTLLDHGVVIGRITDFVDAKNPVFIRKIVLKRPISFSIQFSDKVKIIENAGSYRNAGLSDALLAESPRGAPFYNDYPMPFKQYLQIAGKNSIHILDKGNHHYIVNCSPGTGYMYFIGGPLYPECITNAQDILTSDYDSLLSGTRSWWQTFASRRLNFDQLLPPDVPLRNKLLQTIDDVSVALKTQQGVEGGLLAGHNYHLAYVRDEYGASRCLLTLGYYQEAKDILNFYWKIWQRKGVLHTAQGIGVDAFHIHENDQVELTSYIIIQAFDYLKQTKDQKFLKEIFPMLNWAWNTSKTKLAKDMLPFNGDETYIAGGILPRSCIIDGSAGTTLLFITAGERLLPWIEHNKLWPEDTIKRNERILKAVRLHYRKNFYVDGRLYCNNTTRSVELSLPEFRHGVCEGQLTGCEFFSWTQKNAHNRYLCPICFAKEKGKNLPAFLPKRFRVHSVSLLPLYIGSDILSHREIAPLVDSIVFTFKRTHRLPSRPGGNVTVGYDYGFLLYNLTKLNDSAALEIYKKMFCILDDTGTWSEYYTNGKASGTRYRPWESGINLDAAILFAETWK